MTESSATSPLATKSMNPELKKRLLIALAVSIVVLSGLAYLFLPMIQVALRPKPSTLPGYRAYSGLADVGNLYPEEALESFHEAHYRKRLRGFNPTRLKQIYNLPDDYDSPNTRYSVYYGQGFGPAIGYRVAHQEAISTNQIRFTIDYEGGEHLGYRNKLVLTQTNGVWRVQPLKVTRLD